MPDSEIIHLISRALYLMMLLSAPVVAVSALVGILVGLFQAMTQIQDQAVSFSVRIVAVGFTLFFSARWLSTEIQQFTLAVFERIG